MKTQCEDKLTIEWPPNHSRSVFFKPAIKYTKNICKDSRITHMPRKKKNSLNKLLTCSKLPEQYHNPAAWNDTYMYSSYFKVDYSHEE